MYVLIILVHLLGGDMVTMQQFNTYQACEDAQVIINTAKEQRKYMGSWCTPMGREKQ